MPKDFKMPKFDRTKTLDGNYVELLMALGFLSEEAPGVTREKAGQELAQVMPSFVIGPYVTKVEKGTFKSAAFFFGLTLEKGKKQFLLDPKDIFAFCDYLTEAIVLDAETNPGKHKILDYVRSAVGQIYVMTNINVA